MARVDSLLIRLRHRDAAVRAAAQEELAATLARHGGDERAAAEELAVSVRTLRKGISQREARAPGSPFADFEAHHRSPLGAQPIAAAAAPRLPGDDEAEEPPPARREVAAAASGARAAHSSPQPAAGPLPAPGPAPAPAVALRAADAGEWPHHQPDARVAGAPLGAPEPAARRLAFVLHAHLPWVLGHGRWPHGEDWLAEAVVHCYLPLVGALRRLAARGGRNLLTLSVSPVLAAQLADPRTPPLIEGYLEHRRAAARELAVRHPLGAWWGSTYDALAAQWHDVGGDLTRAFAALAAADVVELSTCAVTHGYLPLLHRPEHVALQIAAARHNHERWFGRPPLGLWMPECAYRPAGPWRHPATGATAPSRPGNEEFLAAAGVRWTVVDAHLLLGGEPLVPYPDLWGAAEEGIEPPPPIGARLQPHRIGTSPVAALPREPHTAHQVWSRHGGYPGDPRYLDFHKRHAESGLRLWRVTDAAGDLGEKLPYHPAEAADAVRDQARHFHELLGGIGGLGGGVAVCPYDAELFGHWWFEGVAWLEAVLGLCLDGAPVVPGASITTTTPARELAEHPPEARVALHEGSWGEAGDHRVWVSEATAWMWDELRAAEEEVHDALPSLPPARARAALKQLLLLAASDWPFLITTGTAADYAAERFRGHRGRLRELLAGGADHVLPVWAAEDLAGVEVDPAWWSAREP